MGDIGYTILIKINRFEVNIVWIIVFSKKTLIDFSSILSLIRLRGVWSLKGRSYS